MEYCCQALVARTLRDSETADERHRKQLFIPLVAAVWITSAAFLIKFLLEPFRINVVGQILALISLSGVLLWALATRTLPLQLVAVVLVLLTFAVILFDVVAAARMASFRPWAWVVLIMDGYLALHVPSTYQRVTLVAITTWVVTYHVEGAFRLGLYNIDSATDGSSAAAQLCECANPPCAQGVVELSLIVPVLIVLFGDYYATRSFAHGLRSEQAHMIAAVSVADRVTAALAGFDLAAAEVALEQAGDELPKRLYESFHRLLHNLSCYRPYLPQSCFEDDDGARKPSTHTGPSCSSSQGEPTAWGTPGERQLAVPAGRTASDPDTIASDSRASELSLDPAGCEVIHLLPAPRPIAVAAHVPQYRTVTQLVINTSNVLSLVHNHSQADTALAAWLADEIDDFVRTVKAQSGVTDLLSGDHMSAGFGTVKAQGSQRTAATHAAVSLTASDRRQSALSRRSSVQLAKLSRTAAVASGRALCGDFGNATTQRFMVIGAVSSFVAAVERTAAAWGVGVLLDSAVHADVEQFWCCRVRKRVRFAKLARQYTILWEVVHARAIDGQSGEWMYELENAQGNPWESYNKAVLAWSTSGPADALDAVTGELDRAGARGGAVVDALRALLELAQECAQPPLGDLSAALAGDPVPLQPRAACWEASPVQQCPG